MEKLLDKVFYKHTLDEMYINYWTKHEGNVKAKAKLVGIMLVDDILKPLWIASNIVTFAVTVSWYFMRHPVILWKTIRFEFTKRKLIRKIRKSTEFQNLSKAMKEKLK